jgi:hypothetical protein
MSRPKTLAIVLSLLGLCLCLALSSGSASAAGFHRCTTNDQLRSHGIFKLRAMNTKCRVARQVAGAFIQGAEPAKGFTCEPGIGGNRIPYTCVRSASVVKFILEA